jgi:hypothetical protein
MTSRRTPVACPGPVRLSRREVLQVGAASFLGLSLPPLLAADAARIGSTRKRAAESCIVIFLNGGPSHLDMWDMKPAAPAEVRGPFKPIATSVTGVQMSEHLPRLARQMHRCALVRSVHHTVNNAHAAAVYASLTGHDRGDARVAIGAGANDYPAIGSTLAMLRPPRRPVVPYVSMPYITQEGAGGPPQPGFFGGVLGRVRDPLFVLRDPNSPSFAMPELGSGPGVDRARLAGRRRLLDRLGPANSAAQRDLAGFQARAFDLLSAPATREAFRIDLEPPAVRDRYGRNIYGQSVLLARRLVEAGSRLACISWAPDANATWDTHGQNFVKLKSTLLPQLDAAVGSLIDDLHQRGMLSSTLVVVMGEFGRTPKVNAAAGRDHWNFCYGLLLAGGPIKGGYVHGASDRIGAYPSRNPVGPGDVVATIYHCLGIAPDTEIVDRLGRPITLVPAGGVIRELLG